MEKQILWRIENEFGSGPYRGRGNIRDTLYAMEDDGTFPLDPLQRPMPGRDKLLRQNFNLSAAIEGGMVFAFKDIEQYNRWFDTPEVRDTLHKAGFFLAKYEVEGRIIHGETQSLFYPHKAQRLATVAINDPGLTPAGAGTLAPRATVTTPS